MKKSELLAKLEAIPDDAEVFVLDTNTELYVKATHVGATTLYRFDTPDQYIERENWTYDPSKPPLPINAICIL